MLCDIVRNRDKLHFFALEDLGYGISCLWQPLAMAEQDLTKYELVPLQTGDQSS